MFCLPCTYDLRIWVVLVVYVVVFSKCGWTGAASISTCILTRAVTLTTMWRSAGGVFRVTATMVIKERKGGAVMSCIKAWFTDVGHQSYSLLLPMCAHVHQRVKSVWCICIQKAEASGFSEPKAIKILMVELIHQIIDSLTLGIGSHLNILLSWSLWKLRRERQCSWWGGNPTTTSSESNKHTKINSVWVCSWYHIMWLGDYTSPVIKLALKF